MKDLHDIWPGGSRILVDLEPLKGDERSGAAFWWNEREIRESVPWSLKISVLMDSIL